jgi:hypothetical protein
MEIIITQWALDSYLDLKHEGAFSAADYKETIRPDVLLLRVYPNDPKFSNAKFWSAATLDKNPISESFKMKWHNLGERRLQLRLSIGLGFKDKLSGNSFLVHAYVKTDPKTERPELAKLMTRVELVRKGRYIERGRLI